MEIVSKVVRMRAVVEDLRRQGRSIGFVPTLGALHEGHLSLVRNARERGAEVVVSVFVNPTQFEDKSDFESYPRDLTRDAELLVGEGVRCVFAPEPSEMYPEGGCSWVEVEGLTEPMAGVTRPGHFRGVTTVVTKLLNIVQPDFAVFGWKDAQQLIVLKRMVRDLHVPVEIVGAPTVRDSDGLACSSRNHLLSEAARRKATSLYRSLQEARRLVSEGERSAEALDSAIRAVLGEEDGLEVDHVEIRRVDDLAPLKKLSGLVLIALSVKVPVEGKPPVRLIDNIRVDAGEEE